jgi:hypothetical protein
VHGEGDHLLDKSLAVAARQAVAVKDSPQLPGTDGDGGGGQLRI